MIKILPYRKNYQIGINKMINEIANEFEWPISNTNQSKPQTLSKHWIAFNETEIIGTIGVLNINNTFTTLKNMFVKKEFRGKNYNTAQMLLNKVYESCYGENIFCIYLGTMNQFKAAQKFYEKNNFIRIDKSNLPESFILNPIDDVFYKKVLP